MNQSNRYEIIRHAILTGQSGSGRTAQLSEIVRMYSNTGVPALLTDTKLELFTVHENPDEAGSVPTEYWDPFGQSGIPIRVSVSDMGPLLMAKILDLNAVQEAVLRICYRLEDEHGYLLLDLEDLQSLLSYVSQNREVVPAHSGQVSAGTLAAIQRRILALEDDQMAVFFGEPALEIPDLIRSVSGKGLVNILDVERLHIRSNLYTSLMLWLLSAICEQLRDVETETIQFIFAIDQAEQMFRGGGADFAERVADLLYQAHRKGLAVILVSEDEAKIPAVVKQAISGRILAGGHHEKPVTRERDTELSSDLSNKYKQPLNRHSAKEMLEARMAENQTLLEAEQRKKKGGSGFFNKMAGSAATTLGREISKNLLRGVMDILQRK